MIKAKRGGFKAAHINWELFSVDTNPSPSGLAEAKIAGATVAFITEDEDYFR